MIDTSDLERLKCISSERGHRIGNKAWVFLMKSDEERSWRPIEVTTTQPVFITRTTPMCQIPSKSPWAMSFVCQSGRLGCGLGNHRVRRRDPNSRKEIRRCPSCRKTNHRHRIRAFPSNICDSCGHVFSDEEVVITFESVTNFRAYYANTWTEAARPVDFRDLAKIQLSQGPLMRSDRSTFPCFPPFWRGFRGEM